MLKINNKTVQFIAIMYIFITCVYAQDTLWTRRFDQFRDEQTLGMTKDTSDNIIIVGTSQDTGIISDILLLKYNQSGNLLWYRLYDTGQIDWGFCVTTDRGGNIFVGSYHSDLLIEKPGITKFSPAGETIWSRMYPGLANCWIMGITLDTQNNIYTCGMSIVDPIAMIMKCDTSGNVLWQRFYNWGDVLGFTDVVLGDNGEIFVTGFYGTFVLLAAKFNSSGDSIWTRHFSGGYSITGGSGITLDHQGNIIIGGYTGNGTDSYDALIIKYNPTGNMLWNRILNYRPIDHLWRVNIDTQYEILAIGSSGPTLDIRDYFLVKLSSSGDIIWTRFYDAGYDDVGTGVVIDRQNNPIITGHSSNGSNYDVLTIKYSGSPGIEEWVNRENVRNNNDYLFRYNSIKSGQGIINLEVLKPSKYKITMYNTLGAVVKLIYSGYLHQGKHNFSLAVKQNGIYFLRIENEWGENSHKIIFLR